MDKCTHDVRMIQWKNIIAECEARPKNVTKREWFKQNGISYQSYYSWQRKIRQEMYDTYFNVETTLPVPTADACNDITFAEIPVTAVEKDCDNNDVTFQPTASFSLKSGLKIDITNNISDSILSKMLEVISHVG